MIQMMFNLKMKTSCTILLQVLRLNHDDVIVVPHEDAQAPLGDTNDPFTSISMSKDFVDKDISANDAY
ncbi:hypothetical protein Tco_0359030 [Tanacetum coccineum]